MAILPDTQEPAEIRTYWIKSTGAWQPIEIKHDNKIESDSIMILCHNGKEFTGGIETFLYSSNPDGKGWSFMENSAIRIPVKRNKGIVCYVKTTKNLVFAITIMGKQKCSDTFQD